MTVPSSSAGLDPHDMPGWQRWFYGGSPPPDGYSPIDTEVIDGDGSHASQADAATVPACRARPAPVCQRRPTACRDPYR